MINSWITAEIKKVRSLGINVFLIPHLENLQVST